VDKLFKLPVGIKKTTLLFKLRLPPDLIEAANPGCPEQFSAGDTVSLGVCCWPSPATLSFPQVNPLCQWVRVRTVIFCAKHDPFFFGHVSAL